MGLRHYARIGTLTLATVLAPSCSTRAQLDNHLNGETFLGEYRSEPINQKQANLDRRVVERAFNITIQGDSSQVELNEKHDVAAMIAETYTLKDEQPGVQHVIIASTDEPLANYCNFPYRFRGVGLQCGDSVVVRADQAVNIYEHELRHNILQKYFETHPDITNHWNSLTDTDSSTYFSAAELELYLNEQGGRIGDNRKSTEGLRQSGMLHIHERIGPLEHATMFAERIRHKPREFATEEVMLSDSRARKYLHVLISNGAEKPETLEYLEALAISYSDIPGRVTQYIQRMNRIHESGWSDYSAHMILHAGDVLRWESVDERYGCEHSLPYYLAGLQAPKKPREHYEQLLKSAADCSRAIGDNTTAAVFNRSRDLYRQRLSSDPFVARNGVTDFLVSKGVLPRERQAQTIMSASQLWNTPARH
jgi:hypothetical protein